MTPDVAQQLIHPKIGRIDVEVFIDAKSVFFPMNLTVIDSQCHIELCVLFDRRSVGMLSTSSKSENFQLYLS